MYIDFSSLFHHSSKDRFAGGRVRIPHDETLWPAAWREVAYKVYPRFRTIPLEESAVPADLFTTIRARHSGRGFASRPIMPRQISALLKYAGGITDQKGEHRAQPSGGGRYPIEIYPIVFAGSEEIRSGLYHYNVPAHGLDVLWERPFMAPDIAQLFTYPWAQQASLAIVLTAVFDRNQRKYGERGYRQILIEAGAIVQNLYLIAEALGIACCAIDGVHEAAIENLIDIDGVTESAVVSVVLG